MTGTTSSTLNQPKKRQSRLDQVLSSRPAIDHDSQPSPTPSLAAATPQKRRNQQLHLLSNHFTPTKNTRSANSSSSVTPKKSNSKSTTPSSSKKQKTTPKSNKKSKSSISRTHPAQLAEDDEQDELISDSDSIGLDQDNNNDVQLPATPASSISTASESPFNLLELIQAGKVEETPRRGRRVGKVNMGWVSPSTRLQKGNQKESLLNSGGKGKAKGKGKRKAVSHQTDDDDDDDDDDYTPQLSGRKSEEPVRIPSWTAPTSTPSKRKQLEEPSTPPIPISASKYNATNAYGVTLIDSQGWAAAGVLGKGERVPYLGSPAQDGMVGLGIGQGDDQLLPSQDSLQSDDLFNSSSDQANKFQLPTQLQPSYDPLSGFSFNNNDSGSPAPVCLKPQEAGRGEGLGTKLIPFQVSGIGRMALHEELVFNFDFLNDNVETSDSNSHGSVPLHRSSDAEGSTSGSSGISGSSNSTNLTSVGTPGPADGSSAPLSGPSPSFSLCSHFPASEPRTPMNAGVKVAPTQETTHQALAAVLKFGAQEPAKEAVTLGSLKLKNAPSAQTIKKLQEVRELVEKSREANRKRKLEVEQSTSSLQEDSSNKRPKHSLRFVGVDTDYVALTLPSLAWPNSDASTPWSSNSHAVNAGQAEKESIMKWLEMKPSTLPVSSSEYEIDAEQRAELEENQLQWSQHPMVAKALRDRARKEEARRILELELAREQRARDRAYGRASARSHAKKAGSHYPKVRRAARASVRQRARKELKAHPDALDGVSASKHRHKPSGAYLIQPPAPVYDPSPEPQVSTTPDAPNAKGKRSQRISVKTKRGASKGKGKEKASESSSTSADAVFGCSCGKTDDDDDTPPMVQCDSCNKWHHLPCIGVESEDQLDAEWYCDACCNPQAVVADEEDANSVATDPLDLELEQRSPASESSFNVLSTPKTHASTPTSASNRFLNGHRLAEPVFAQPMESPMRNMRQPLAASALALAPSPPMMSSSRYRGPPSHLVQDSQSNSQFPQSSVYASPGYHPHAHQREDERYGRGRVRAERIGGWLNMENSEAQDSERRKEEEDLNEQGSPLARKSTPIKRGEDLFSSQPQSQSHQDLEDSRKVSTSAQPISRPRTPTTPRLADKEGQEGLRSPVMGLSTPSRHARFEKRSNHHFSDDEDHSAHRDDVFSTPSRLMGGSASWGYSRGAPGGSASRAGSQTPGKSSLPTFSRDMFGDASGSGHQRRDSSQWGLPSALRTPSRDIVSRGSGSFTPNLGVDHSGGYSVGLPSLVFSSGGLDMDSHPPSYSNHPSSSSDYHHHHPSSSSSTSRAWQLQSPTSTTRAGAARARQSSASYAHSLGLGTPGGMLRTPELQPTFNRGASNNSSIRGTSHHSKSRANGRERERERSRSPSPTKRSKNGSEEMTLPSLKKSSGKTKRRNAQDSEDEEDHSSQAPNSSSPFPPTPTFEGQIRRLESSMDDSRIPSSARKLANLAGGGNSTPLSKSYSQPGFNFTRTPPSEESNRLALSALLDSPADLGSQNRKRNASGLGIGLALDDVLDWS